MDQQYVTPPKSSFVDKVKSFFPRNQSVAIVAVEFVALLFLAGGAFAYISLTGKNTKTNQVVVVENNNLPVDDPTPTPEGVIQEFIDDETDASPSATPTLFPSVSLLVYSNPTYFYSIKYPVGWTITNRGALEPQIPSYVVFNPASASAGFRAVAVYISTRSYQAQIDLVNANEIPVTIDRISGVQQVIQDSNGTQTTRIILPSDTFLYVLEGKVGYLTTFTQMLTTFNSTLN